MTKTASIAYEEKTAFSGVSAHKTTVFDRVEITALAQSLHGKVLQAHDPSNRAARGSLTQAIVYVLTFTFPAVIQVTTFLRKTRVGKICYMVVM